MRIYIQPTKVNARYCATRDRVFCEKIRSYVLAIHDKARKRGWYFLKSDIEEKFPEFFIFIENARKYRQQYNRKKKEKQKKKVKPRKPRIPNDKLHRDSVDKKWKRIAKESIPISP